VCWVGHVRVDSSVGTVCPASLFLGPVGLDMGDVKRGEIQPFGLGIGQCIFQQVKYIFHRLHRPAAPSFLEFLRLPGSAASSGVSHERDASLPLKNISEVAVCFLHGHSSDNTNSFTGVLEMTTQVRSTGLCAF